MSSFRAEFMRQRLGTEDPHAALFLSEAARRYARAADRADPAAVSRSLARFDHFSRRMAGAAGRIEQFLVLGAGLDTRPLWLPEIVAAGTRVIEVDLPSAIEHKLRILAENGITYPGRVVAIGMDLGSPDLPAALRAAGLDAGRPVAVFMEGVAFQLPAETARRVIDPRHLPLAPGSEITFDYWTNDRVTRRNARISTSPMHPFPHPEEPAALRDALLGLGYGRVEVRAVSELVARLWPDADTIARDWFVVDATVTG